MIYITVNVIYVADILSLCVSAKHEDFYDCDSVTVDVHHSRSVVFVSLSHTAFRSGVVRLERC